MSPFPRQHPRRRSIRSLIATASILSFVLSVLAVATQRPAEATFLPTYDWSMPDRFTDRDDDGFLDYYASTAGGPAGLPGRPDSEIVPASWRVDFNACGNAGATAFQWWVNGEPVTMPGGTGCQTYYEFDSEGTWRVTLQVTANGVTSQKATQEVVVQDWLIIALGDSYGSGEGNPEKVLLQDQLHAIEQAAADVEQKFAALLTAQSNYEATTDKLEIAEQALQAWDQAVKACDVTAPWFDAELCATVPLRLADVTAAYLDVGLTFVGETATELLNDAWAAAEATLNLAETTYDQAVQIFSNLDENLTATWQNRRCHRSSKAGSARAAQRIENDDPRTSVTYIHLACTGAQVMQGLLGPYAGSSSEKESDPNAPLPPQVDEAAQLITDPATGKQREIDALYISIGGNDAHFADVVMACMVQEPCYQTPTTHIGHGALTNACNALSVGGLVRFFQHECQQFVDDILATGTEKTAVQYFSEGLNGVPNDPIYKGLDTLYELLDDKVTPDPNDPPGLLPASRSGRVYLSEYVDATRDETGSYCDFGGPRGLDAIIGWLVDETQWADTQVAPVLNQAIATNAQTHGWTLVDGIAAGTANHGYCSSDPYMVRIPESLIKQANPDGAVHPNYAGHGVYADRIYAKIFPDFYPHGGDLTRPRRPDHAPFADAGQPITVAEGSSTVLANDTWDGDGDSFTYAWSVPASLATLGSSSAATPTLTGVDDGTGLITLTVQDEDGADTDTAPLSVTNVAPTVDAGVDIALDEGDTLTRIVTYTDPGAADTHTATVDYGDGTVVGPVPVSGGQVSLSHLYPDDDACPTPCTVSVTVTDDDAGTHTDSFVVTVNNVAPTVDPIVAPIDPILVGASIMATSSFSDPGTDTYRITWDWGDGTTTQHPLGVVGEGPLSESHTYTSANVYEIVLTVEDDDGGVATTSFLYAVVYDPAAGFATGGGWLESPVGAYVPDPSLSGRAVFAFSSQYDRGATVPKGNATFRFQAAGLEFASTSYQWLVVAGDKGQFKGEGTINGEPGFGFMMTASDGDLRDPIGPDRLRVKIWDTSTDEVVYDNQLGAPDNAEASTAIGGGSIRVHDGKKK